MAAGFAGAIFCLNPAKSGVGVSGVEVEEDSVLWRLVIAQGRQAEAGSTLAIEVPAWCS